MRVRTRYAPSPTGYMHIGNLRTALYEYLIAKAQGGEFILRIEDTDRERLVEGAVDVIYSTLKQVGMKHDEGPDVGGDFGPYIQSERKGIYLPYAKELVQKGEAYYCFCTKDRLDSLRESNEKEGKTNMYDRHCLSLSNEEIEENLANGVPYVIRQKTPDGGTTSFVDAVYGEIELENDMIEDQILVKSDMLPTYNFANVIDDHLMEITHVVRGSEYLTSTPKYNLLYNAFGWDIPEYIHLPLITNAEGHKLSKRDGAVSFEQLVEDGYLPEAIVNYVVMLGWSPETNDEMFSLSELEEIFKVSGISKSPSVFDYVKLRWFNKEYIKNMEENDFHSVAEKYYDDIKEKTDIDTLKVSRLIHSRTELFSEIPEKIAFLSELPQYDTELFVHKKSKTTEELSLEALLKSLPIIEGVDSWEEEDIHSALFSLVAELEWKNSQLLWPVRIAIAGTAVTPGGAIEIAYTLGKDECIRRMKIAIEKLEGK